MKKVGRFISVFLPMIAAFACQMAVSVVASLVYSVFLAMQAMQLGIQDETEIYNYSMERLLNPDYLLIVTGIATLYTLVIGFFWYRPHRPKTDFTLKQTVNGKLLAAMLLLGISLQLIVSMCLNAVFTVLPQDMTDAYGELMETLIGGNVWISLIVTVVLAPLAEELLFRGVTLKKAQKIMPFMAANILQALLFGIYHGNLIQGTYAFLLGLILGFTAEYFHSIWAPILLHAFVNGSAELLSLLPGAATESWIGLVLLCAFAVVCLFVSVKLYPKARKEPAPIAAENTVTEEKFTENSFDE